MLGITKELAVDANLSVNRDIDSVMYLFFSKYYCSGASYKYRFPLFGLEAGYDKTRAYSWPVILKYNNMDDRLKYYLGIHNVLAGRKVTEENLFNTIVLIDSLLPSLNEIEWASCVQDIMKITSNILHIEAYRLAVCARAGIPNIQEDIANFIEIVEQQSICEMQSRNAFYGKRNKAAEHEFAYLCLGILYLSHYTGNKKCQIMVKKLFDDVHGLFVKRKQYLLDSSSSPSNAANALMSCFFLSFYLLEGDPRSLNAASYLLEDLDACFKPGFGVPVAMFPSLSRFKAPAWTLAYYMVAKCLHVTALDKFKEGLTK